MTTTQQPGSRNVIGGRDGRIHLAPSILAADFAMLADECRAAVDAGASILHLDVMDGHFVPNLTFGPALVSSLRSALPDVCLDTHLMVTDPSRFVDPFIDAGADHITFHAEVAGGDAAKELAGRIRDRGCSAGIAINPDTPYESVHDLADWFDLLLVMSVHPGFAGQAFIADVLTKTSSARQGSWADRWIQMDGGISPETAGRVRDSGCDALVAGSAFFGKDREAWKGVADEILGT
ncbi:MAG: ribulose-phosphate 3-epimerase [Planctomycetota bacterium]